MGIVMGTIIAATVIWLFMDVTKHKIAHAGWWVFGGFVLWIVVFPWYLIQRRKMIEQAQDNPTETKLIELKLFVIVLFGAGFIWLQQLASEVVMEDIDRLAEERVERRAGAVEKENVAAEITAEKQFNVLIPVDTSPEDEALSQQAMQYLFNHVCPRLEQEEGLFKEPISIRVGKAATYQKKRHGWERVVSIEMDLSDNRNVLGKAAQTRCVFDLGKDGTYVKNTCAKAACRWPDEPENGDMVTFRKDDGLSFIK